MGKTVLLLLTAVVIGGTMLSLGQATIMASTDESHRENASEAYSREMADAATQAVLATALRDRSFATGIQPGRLASYGGGDFELTNYSVSGPNDSRVDFTVRGRFPYRLDEHGEPVYTEQEVTSAYEWVPPGFPCALSLGSYMNQLNLEGSSIGGIGLDGEPRPSCFDRRRYDSYRLDDFPGLEWENHEQTLANPDSGMVQSNPLAGMAIPGPGHEYGSMSEMYADHNAPAPDVFSTNAPGYISEGDARFPNPYTIGAGETISVGDPDFGEDPRIAYFDSSLTIEQNGRLQGAGLLVVNGNLILKEDAAIDWAGMVIVRSRADTLLIDLDPGSVTINGTFVVDHDAPPPGGHMDLTVWRDYTNYFAAPWGEAVLDWQKPSGPNKKVYAHTHRYGDRGAGRTPLSGTSWQGQSSSSIYPSESRPIGGENGARRIAFRDPDINPLHTISGNPALSSLGIGTAQPGVHEQDTRFHEALSVLGNQQVYVQFVDEDGLFTPGGKGRPDRYDGASRVTLELPGQTPCVGTPADLGENCRRSGSRPNASKPFQANQLDGLVLEIGSLRLLRRITDHEPLSPDGDFYEDDDGHLHGNLLSAAYCPAVTDGTSYFRDRDGYCTSNDNPVTMSYFPERKGALRLQIRLADGTNADKLVYEAAMYWHRKAPGTSEHEQEVEADEDFFEAVANGEDYGVSFIAGDALTIEFSETTLLPLYERFGRNNPQLAHLSSRIQRIGGYAQEGPPAP
jgi:hypothetical protein